MAEFDQQSLFDDYSPPPRITRRRTPIARNDNPVTSHEAAEFLTSSGARDRQVRQVAAAVHQWPGLTAWELAERSGLTVHVVGRRLSEVESLGLARRGSPKRQANGRRGVTWWPPAGSEEDIGDLTNDE